MTTTDQHAAGQAPRGDIDPRAIGTQPPEPVGPLGAVKSFYARFARFSGRASRSEYWWMVLLSLLAGWAGEIIVWALGGGTTNPVADQDPETLNAFGRGFLSVWGLLGLLHLIPGVTLLVRRLHDVNFGGLWALLGLLPVIGQTFLLICTLMPSVSRGARFDQGAAEQEERDRIAAGLG